MPSYNKVILLGHLTRDPELRVTPGGMSVCKFGLAVNRQYTRQDGTAQEEVTFVDVDAFGKQADVIHKFCTKGRALLVEGRLRLDSWETQSGEKRSKLGVVLESFQFVGGRGGPAREDGSEGAGDPPPAQEPPPPPRPAYAPPPARPARPTQQSLPPAIEDEDEIPF